MITKDVCLIVQDKLQAGIALEATTLIHQFVQLNAEMASLSH